MKHISVIDEKMYIALIRQKLQAHKGAVTVIESDITTS